MESPKDGKLVFEKEGTRGQNFAYNGIWGAQNGQVVLERVKARIYDRGDGTYRLSCEAFVIPDANSITIASTKSGSPICAAAPTKNCSTMWPAG